LDWLNATFAGLWPRVNAAAQKIVHEEVTHQIQAQMPAIFRNTHFSEFSLGTSPPVLGPIKVYEMNGGMRMTLAIDYRSDVDVSLQVGLLSVGVRSLCLSGELVVRLEQLIDEAPVVGGLVIYFLNPPMIDFTLTGIGAAAEFPGLRGVIRRAIDNAVGKSIVLPNQLAVPLGSEAQGVDRAEMMLAKPLGMLRVSAVSADGLRAPDWEEAGKEAADAYVVVRTADERWESSTVEGACDPVWPDGEFGDLFVYDHEQRIWATVFDHDSSETSDFVGVSRDMSLSEALSSEGSLALYAREHVREGEDEDLEADTRGQLTLDCRFLEFVPDDLCGDRLVLCVKVDTISLPPEFPGEAQLAAKVGEGGSKATPFGREVAEHEGSVVVSDLLRDVIVRSGEKGLSVEDIADITALDVADVSSVLEGGEVAEEAVLAKTRRLVRVEACLFLPLSAESVSSELVELTVADRTGRRLASTEIALADLAEADHFTLADALTMATDEGAELEAHVSLHLMGTRMASTE